VIGRIYITLNISQDIYINKKWCYGKMNALKLHPLRLLWQISVE
jgi:hypothetical protein